MNTRGRLVAVVLFIALAAPSAGRAQTGGSRVFGELLKRIPAQANGLMLVNVDGLFDSPMGRRENWRQKALENHRGGLGLAENISKAAVATGIDYHSMDERWKVGLVQLRKDVPVRLAEIAAREGGYVETVESTPVAWTPRGFYLFDFPDAVVGFTAPCERKSLSGWFRSALWHPRSFPPGFADRAVIRADAGAQIVFALDLADAVSPQMVEPWLNTIDSIKKTHTDPSLLAPRLASVKSAFLVVRVDQSITGELRIDFDRDVDYTTPVARALVLNVLEDFGAELPEMKSWNLGFDGKKALEMSGRLSEESMRKVLSIAHVPRFSAGAPAPGTPTVKPEPKAAGEPSSASANTRSDKVSASQVYFRSVTAAIDGLKKVDRPTYRSNKLWYDRYAKQVEELSILGVDKELLDWGAMVARTMREMSSGINYYSQNHKYAVASDTSGTYGGYGAYYGNSRAYNADAMKSQTEAMMSVDLDKRWQAVETSVAEVRSKMVEKYQVDF